MIIKSLSLKNYRNYDYLELKPDPNINIFYGNNAQGKTNLLESIYLAGTTRSHRGAKDREVISFDREESHIELILERKGLEYDIDIHLKRNKTKGVAINKIPIQRAGELYGIVNLVFFSPEDLNIIKNAPSERRKFIDMELCQLDRIYLHDLTHYYRVLEQRNKLLKDAVFNPEILDTLDIWDMQLIDYGEKIIRRRQDFIRDMDPITREIHSKLTGGKENLELIYEPDVGLDSMEQAVSRYRDRDLKLRTTTVGPHRDDLKISSNGIDLRTYGSQGQQRTAALSLKLSEIRLVKEMIDDTPILLLDDVLSELDGSRQEYLLSNLEDIQTLITCTGVEDLISHRFRMNRIYHVTEGAVTQEH